MKKSIIYVYLYLLSNELKNRIIINLNSRRKNKMTKILESIASQVTSEQLATAGKFKEKMLAYENPVEFVNNMYGCHPDDSDRDYFQAIFS
jgi:hypothetical protein